MWRRFGVGALGYSLLENTAPAPHYTTFLHFNSSSDFLFHLELLPQAMGRIQPLWLIAIAIVAHFLKIEEAIDRWITARIDLQGRHRQLKLTTMDEEYAARLL
jgi:hypothetical protein